LHLQSPPDSGPHATRLDAGLQRRHMGWIQIRHRRRNSGEPKKGWCFIGGWGCGCWCLVWFKHGDLDLGELIFDDPIFSKKAGGAIFAKTVHLQLICGKFKDIQGGQSANLQGS